jgi:uncharacterized protein YqgQ
VNFFFAHFRYPGEILSEAEHGKLYSILLRNAEADKDERALFTPDFLLKKFGFVIRRKDRKDEINWREIVRLFESYRFGFLSKNGSMFFHLWYVFWLDLKCPHFCKKDGIRKFWAYCVRFSSSCLFCQRATSVCVHQQNLGKVCFKFVVLFVFKILAADIRKAQPMYRRGSSLLLLFLSCSF